MRYKTILELFVLFVLNIEKMWKTLKLCWDKGLIRKNRVRNVIGLNLKTDNFGSAKDIPIKFFKGWNRFIILSIYGFLMVHKLSFEDSF